MTLKYIVKRRPVITERGAEKYDVVCLGPNVVAADLKWIEAEALAKALNEEQENR